MNRMIKALGAFALTLALSLTMACAPFASAAEVDEAEGYAGYLVMLIPRDQVAAPVGVMGQATLMASYDERDGLLELSEEEGVYKANDLADIQNLVYSGQVLVAEPDYEVQLLDLATDHLDPTKPNDPYFTSGSYQYNLMDSDQFGISVRAAWEAGLTGEGVTVAVIDTGINPIHVDYPAKVARGRYYFYREAEGGIYSFTIGGVTRYYNYYSNDDVEDDKGHGSMVSGIIAAKKDNGEAIAGIAPNVTILPIRCFTTNAPKELGGYVSNLYSGINYAVDNGAQIINMSFGLTTTSTVLNSAIQRAYRAGCILIAAAGNDGTDVAQYPASFENVIGVGATDKTGYLASYSQRNSSVDVCAPGSAIYSMGSSSDRAIGYGSGTSYSAPMVAAAAALLKEAHPNMTQDEFMLFLEASCDPVPLRTASEKAYTGVGVLNMEKLLDVAGCTGVSVTTTADGTVFRAAYHPEQDETTTLDPKILLMLGAYNAQGHLLDSQVMSATLSKYGAYTGAYPFQVPEAATYQAFYLKHDGTLSALIDPETVEAP